MGNFFDQLPSDVVLDIITRLPTETVLDCKLVCKPWKKLISHHPSFIQLHSNRLLNGSSDYAGELSFLVLIGTDDELYYLEYDEKHDGTPVGGMKRINLTVPFPTNNWNEYKIVGSFNGLVCLYGWREDAYCICNPVTKEYFMLPEIKCDSDDDEYIHCSSGFGYIPLTNEYKVVKFVLRREKEVSWFYRRECRFIEVFVYALGRGNGWRNVGRVLRVDSESYEMYPELGVYGDLGVHVNGVLHWAHVKGGRVLTLNLAEEKFDYLSPPDLPPDHKWFDYTVGVFNGVLYYAVECYNQRLKNTCYDIWLLEKEKNVSGMREKVEQVPLGWRKEFSSFLRKPLAFTKCGGVLCFSYRPLSIYDPVASALKTLVSFSAFKQIICYMPTLVSLKGLAAEEEDIKFLEAGYRFMEPLKFEEIASRDLQAIQL